MALDRLTARYVCFNDNPDVKAFFIFTENKYLREYMISNGTFDKLSKAEQAELKKEFLIFRGYDKGVPLATANMNDSEQAQRTFVKRRLLA